MRDSRDDICSTQDDLADMTLKGGMWMFGIRFANKLFGVLRKIILARILAPHDFGLFGIALLMLSASEVFTTTGFSRALIYKQGDIKSYHNTAWLIEAGRGLVLFLTLLLLAPAIALFFGEPLAVPILRTLALVEFVKGLKSIGIIHFERDLDFRKKFYYILSGTVVDFAISVTAALILRSVWALVYGILAGDIVRAVVSYIMFPFRPTLEFSLEKAKELFVFGKWKLLSGIILFISLYLDDMAVGRMLGVTSLALFQMAFQMSNITATEISHAVVRVAFPSYSKLQHNKERLNSAFKRTLELILTFALPVAGGMIVLASLGIRVVLGEDWLPMTTAFQILAVGGLLRTIGDSGTPVLFAMGYPKGVYVMNRWRLVTMAVAIVPLTYWGGLEGAALTSTLALLTTHFPLMRLLNKLLGSTAKEYTRLIYCPLICTLFMMGTLAFIRRIIPEEGGLQLLVLTLLGGGVYIGSLYIFHQISRGPWNNLQWVAKRLGKGFFEQGS